MRDVVATLLRLLLPVIATLVFAPTVQAESCRANCLAPGDYDL